MLNDSLTWLVIICEEIWTFAEAKRPNCKMKSSFRYLLGIREGANIMTLLLESNIVSLTGPEHSRSRARWRLARPK